MKRERKLKSILFQMPIIILLMMVFILYFLENIMVQQYTGKLAGTYIEERLEILDAYYYDKGYEGYYEKNKEYFLSVYHFVLDENKNIVFPFKEYEDEGQWNTMETIRDQMAGGKKEKKGKLPIENSTYFYTSKFYQGEFDDFFIKEKGNNIRTYEVVVYTNISMIDSFSHFINKVFIVQMILSILAGLIMIWTITTRLERGFLRLRDYIQKVETKKEMPEPPDCFYVELNRIVTALHHMGKRVQKAERKQESFFQNASHELRTPLMSIQGYAEGIYYDTIEDHKVAAEVIIKNSDKMRGLVEEILFLSRMELEKSFENHPLNLEGVLSKIVEDGRKEAELKKIQIEYQSEGDEIKLLGDEKLLERAIANVVSNAIRYAKEKIAIIVTANSHEVILTIQDDGEGISKEDAPHIFKRFYKGKGGVSGIGLAITYEAVTRMGGEIWMKREENLTMFYMRFPRCDF